MARLRLADLERERAEEEFEVEGSDGAVYKLPNPKSLQFEVLSALDDADNDSEALRILLGNSDYATFAADPLVDGFGLEAILDGWRRHFGLPSRPERRASRR